MTCDTHRQCADTPPDSPLTCATARSPGLYSGSESNATAWLFAPFPANNISDEISQVKNEAAGHYLDDLTTEAL